MKISDIALTVIAMGLLFFAGLIFMGLMLGV
jgi:hypothetical protein